MHRLLPRGIGFGLSNRRMFDAELEQREVAYDCGDVFLLITDGITECLDPDGDDFGEDRVMALLAGHAHGSARQLVDRLSDEVRRFTADAVPFDDQTIVVVKATG